MLLRIPSVRRAGLRRIGKCAWRAIDIDPQFTFTPRLLGASYILFDLREADRALDPRVYIDTGAGFAAGEEFSLRQTRAGVYVVALRGFGRVRAIRFDPASFPSRFTFRAFVAYDETAVRAWVGRRLRAAAREGSEAPSCEIIAKDGATSLPGVGARVEIRSPSKHFEQVIGLAAARYGDASPWPGPAPAISFVTPVFDAPARYLDQLLDSFRLQRRGAFELILCDDGSTSAETIRWLRLPRDLPWLKILRGPAHGGIAAATNRGVFAATGEWIGLLDHDDALAPFAVDALLEAIERAPGAQFLFTDEIVTDANLTPQAYFLKPAFDPVLLSGVNYVNHLSLYRRERLLRLGGLRAGFEGSQDYDLVLRHTRGLETREIVHLPYPAYLWRRDGASFSARRLAQATEAARRALAESYARDGAPAVIEPALAPDLHRPRLAPRGGEQPSVSIVIPNRDSFALVSRLFDDLTRRTDYPKMEIIVVDNGSSDRRVLELYERMRAGPHAFRADIVPEPFNFARQINRGLRVARGDCVLLLNNDIETIEPDWLKEMVSCLAYPSAGVVGARLLYPNGALQHAGVIAGLGSVAGHWFCGMPGDYPGPMGRLRVRQSFTAVTGACLLVSRPCLEAVGELDEATFAIAYNDTDFCLRAGRAGFRVVWTPFATLRHHESASRGSDETRENIERFRREQEALRARYGLLDYLDPAYNPWYSRDSAAPRLVLPADLPVARCFVV